MNTFTIIILISIALFICVAVITVIQKKEQQKAIKRQQIAKFRFRANQALEILSNFGQLPIGPEARKTMLLYSLANLKAINNLSSDNTVRNNIEELQAKIQSPESAIDTRQLTIPNDLELLSKQINQLSTLSKFILKLSKTKIADPQLVTTAFNRIVSLISESKICAFIQQGKTLLAKHDYVEASRSFLMAQQMLAKVVNKNDRLIRLESQLEELIKSTPEEAMMTKLSFEPTENLEQPGITEQFGDAEETLFGPKKKW